ncbi:GerAB/ArcD/ProY family transporter [Peribacillus kribbensis]|uniref:GerAB/ArcD/ProY family transporter n=1 Tax=Peribacillus kribbensis TaxID=356658 RepID=UPI0009D67E59
MLFQYLGFEPLFMFCPFIKNSGKLQKWTHLGLLFSTLLYLVIALISLAFFSQEHLNNTKPFKSVIIVLNFK